MSLRVCHPVVGRVCPARPQPALPAIGRVVTGCSALANWRRCQPRALRSPRSYDPMFQPVGTWGGSLGAASPRAMVTVWKKVCRHRHAVAGLEVGPAHVFRGHAFSIPGTGRACARATPPDLPFLDGPAPTDSRVTDRQGLGARAGSKSLAWAPQSQRHGAFAQESRARLSLRRRYPRRYRRVRRSSGLLGAAGVGLQLLLGPGTSGVDVTFLTQLS